MPTTVGPYTLLRALGDGSSGRVLLARTDHGARVALKVFRPELTAYPRFRERLRAEVEATAGVRSPRVVAPFDADTEGERVWVATEYVEGSPLHTVVAERGPLGPTAARRLGAGLAEAVTALHAAGVVHGDLTPGEVLLGPDGPHVTDAGLARATATTPLTRGGALVGTLGYLAPEQVEGGAAGPEADVFALGAVLLFAATWRRPFGDGDAIAVLHRVLHDGPDLAGLPADLAAVVAACLSRDPGARPDPEQVRAALLDDDGPAPPAATVSSGRHAAVPATGPPAALTAESSALTADSAAEPVEPWPVVVRRRIPAPYRGLSRARRVAGALGVFATLVGLLAVGTADTVGTPPPEPVLAPIRAALAESFGR